MFRRFSTKFRTIKDPQNLKVITYQNNVLTIKYLYEDHGWTDIRCNNAEQLLKTLDANKQHKFVNVYGKLYNRDRIKCVQVWGSPDNKPVRLEILSIGGPRDWKLLEVKPGDDYKKIIECFGDTTKKEWSGNL